MKEKITRERENMAGEHAGHRKRIIQKLESGVLLDHELLEILLFPLQPRKNTNDLAHRLLKQFGSIHGVFSASIEELMQIKGVGESIAANLRCIGIVYRKHFLEAKNRFNGKFESKNFIAYIKERYENLDCEVIELYLLRKNGEVMKTQRYTDQSETFVRLDSAELSKILAKESPSGVVMVHNHPHGEATPSKMDDEMTHRCQIVCSMHGILFCDHIIYAPDGVYSYYLSGKLQEISRNYSISEVSGIKEKKD